MRFPSETSHEGYERFSSFPGPFVDSASPKPAEPFVAGWNGYWASGPEDVPEAVGQGPTEPYSCGFSARCAARRESSTNFPSRGHRIT